MGCRFKKKLGLSNNHAVNLNCLGLDSLSCYYRLLKASYTFDAVLVNPFSVCIILCMKFCAIIFLLCISF